MVKITRVESGSRAEKAGIREGDSLLSIGGNEIEDVLDYRFYLADRFLTLVCEREGKRYETAIRKGEYDDIGLDFETPLMDKKHSCRNRCVFCFIDQLPTGLRESLYFKDDDARLSFLHGNYITLTNLTEKDIDRILRMHLSPIHISIHTTNPDLRIRMMHNKRAGEVLSYIDRLAEAGISLCGQIVLCKGLNDGAELERTMRELCRYLPSLGSVSVVPAGLTRYREGLYPLEDFTPEECRAVIAQIDAMGEKCLATHGTRLFFPADEFFVKGSLPLPSEDYYEGYPQIENGVGMLRSLAEDVGFALEDLEPTATRSRTLSIATGAAAYEQISALAERIEKAVPNLRLLVYRIANHFFGESVTVTGLLTGVDLYDQLKDKELGEKLLLSNSTLRAEGDMFLCNMTPSELEQKLGTPIRFTDAEDGGDLVRAILENESAFPPKGRL